jgi:hypothetical protein
VLHAPHHVQGFREHGRRQQQLEEIEAKAEGFSTDAERHLARNTSWRSSNLSFLSDVAEWSKGLRQHRSLEATIFSEDSGEERTLEVVFEPAIQDVLDGGRRAQT